MNKSLLFVVALTGLFGLNAKIDLAQKNKALKKELMAERYNVAKIRHSKNADFAFGFTRLTGPLGIALGVSLINGFKSNLGYPIAAMSLLFTVCYMAIASQELKSCAFYNKQYFSELAEAQKIKKP